MTLAAILLLGERLGQRQVGEHAEGMATRTGEGMQEVAGNMKSALDRSIRDQPMATLAVAAAVGFVLGAIWET